MGKEMKLTIELVPMTSWYNNMRSVVSQFAWDKVRKQAYADYGYRCGVCKAKARLNCHEIWEYDDLTHVQKLKGFIALCDSCHHIKHIGLAGILAKRGQLNFDKVVEHFMKVNECSKETFEDYVEKAFEQWNERSKHEWRVDLGECKSMVRNNAQSYTSAS